MIFKIPGQPQYQLFLTHCSYANGPPIQSNHASLVWFPFLYDSSLRACICLLRTSRMLQWSYQWVFCFTDCSPTQLKEYPPVWWKCQWRRSVDRSQIEKLVHTSTASFKVPLQGVLTVREELLNLCCSKSEKILESLTWNFNALIVESLTYKQATIGKK